MGWAAGSSGCCWPRAAARRAAPLDLYVAYAHDDYRAPAFRLAAVARRAGQAARVELAGGR
jgi:hypothetical protein